MIGRREGRLCTEQLKLLGLKLSTAKNVDRVINGLTRCYAEKCDHLFDARTSKNDVLCPCCS